LTASSLSGANRSFMPFGPAGMYFSPAIHFCRSWCSVL
jgi:hypothetical protein